MPETEALTLTAEQIDSFILDWSMRPQPETPVGDAWEAGARQGWEWAQRALSAAQKELETLPGLEKFLGLSKDELEAFLRQDEHHTAGIVRALCAMVQTSESRAESLQSVLTESERDAKRYRWLRDRPSFIGWDWWQPHVPNHVNITPEFMDAAIDAALKESSGGAEKGEG